MKQVFFRIGRYFRTDAYVLLISLGAAVLSVVVGIFLPDNIKDYLMSGVIAHYRSISFSWSGIFLNNLLAALVLSAGGFIIALPTLYIGIMNFSMLGVASELFARELGTGGFILSILPHGIFELPAILLAMALGFSILKSIIPGKKAPSAPSTQDRLIDIGLCFAFIVIPAIAIAALIEVTVSPLLIAALMK